jgi:hypothetical protein
VFIHPFAGVLSAYGMGLADQTVMREQAVEAVLDESTLDRLCEVADELTDAALAELRAQGSEFGANGTPPPTPSRKGRGKQGLGPTLAPLRDRQFESGRILRDRSRLGDLWC